MSNARWVFKTDLKRIQLDIEAFFYDLFIVFSELSTTDLEYLCGFYLRYK